MELGWSSGVGLTLLVEWEDIVGLPSLTPLFVVTWHSSVVEESVEVGAASDDVGSWEVDWSTVGTGIWGGVVLGVDVREEELGESDWNGDALGAGGLGTVEALLDDEDLSGWVSSESVGKDESSSTSSNDNVVVILS